MNFNSFVDIFAKYDKHQYTDADIIRITGAYPFAKLCGAAVVPHQTLVELSMQLSVVDDKVTEQFYRHIIAYPSGNVYIALLIECPIAYYKCVSFARTRRTLPNDFYAWSVQEQWAAMRSITWYNDSGDLITPEYMAFYDTKYFGVKFHSVTFVLSFKPRRACKIDLSNSVLYNYIKKSDIYLRSLRYWDSKQTYQST